MSHLSAVATLSARVFAWLAILAIAVLSTAWLAAGYASHRVTQQLAQGSSVASHIRPLNLDEAIEIDFYQAAGFTQEQLAAFLQRSAEREGVDQFPLHITLQDDDGEYLVDSRILVRWNGGEYRLLLGESGVLRFQITASTLDGLRIVAPREFPNLKQKTIPLGNAYEPEERPDLSELPYDVVWDGFVSGDLQRQLVKLAAEGRAVPNSELLKQLRRRHTSLTFPASPESESPVWSPARIYADRKQSVVVVGTLHEGGGLSRATGVVLSSDGVIATAYHVLDKPTATTRGVMTADGKMFAVLEVLAASRADDVALLKVDGTDMTAAPLSGGDAVGSQVTVIAHPGPAFFSLTEGYISRYWAATHYGRLSIKMSITAEFADGSSGGPIFNDRGEVTGIVSSTDALGDQMVVRIATPAQAIRDLVMPTEAAAEDS